MKALLAQSELARHAQEVGQRHNFTFKVVGTGEPIVKPTYNDGWWLMPTREIPSGGEVRLKALQDAGIKISSVAIAYESPRLLGAPQPKPQPQKNTETPQIITTNIVEGLLYVGAILGVVAGFFLQAMAMSMVDPALIVTLEDGTQLELMNWRGGHEDLE